MGCMHTEDLLVLDNTGSSVLTVFEGDLMTLQVPMFYVF